MQMFTLMGIWQWLCNWTIRIIRVTYKMKDSSSVSCARKTSLPWAACCGNSMSTGGAREPIITPQYYLPISWVSETSFIILQVPGSEWGCTRSFSCNSSSQLSIMWKTLHHREGPCLSPEAMRCQAGGACTDIVASCPETGCSYQHRSTNRVRM